MTTTETHVIPANLLIIKKDIPLHLDNVLEVLDWPANSGMPTELAAPPLDEEQRIKVLPANSGNFVKLAPLQDVLTNFRVVPWKEWRELLASNWRLVKVDIDECLGPTEAWWNGQRWNGWACPVMTLEQFEAMVPKWNACDNDPMVTHEDGSVSPADGWSVFDTITDEDGFTAYYFISGQEGERRIDGKWWNPMGYDEETREYRVLPRDQWEEVDLMSLSEIDLPGLGPTVVIDVSCGLCWDIEYDPAEPPEEGDE